VFAINSNPEGTWKRKVVYQYLGGVSVGVSPTDSFNREYSGGEEAIGGVQFKTVVLHDRRREVQKGLPARPQATADPNVTVRDPEESYKPSS
jgi:hypothetical protein